MSRRSGATGPHTSAARMDGDASCSDLPWRQPGFAGDFRVVHKSVAVRDQPSTKAKIVGVAKAGRLLRGVVQDVDGESWLALDVACCHKSCFPPGAHILMHGAKLGLGYLLRPNFESSENLKELLSKLHSGSEVSSRAEALVDACAQLGIHTGSQLLRLKLDIANKSRVDALIEKWRNSSQLDAIKLPVLEHLCIAVEDSRLAFSGFPWAPPWTKCKLLFTAPHSLPLCRVGHQAHLPEKYTSFLARALAEVVGGAYLTWSAKENVRARDAYRYGGEPDLSNTDPNFTHKDFLRENPWTRNLREVKSLFGPGRPCLHVDLHGCRDPTSTEGSHLVVGLRAMEFGGRSLFAEELRQALRFTFAVALKGLSVNVRPLKQLTGALSDDRRTLTQQSLTLEGGAWTCSMQLEMSRFLRKKLSFDKELRALMAQAIHIAWTLVSRDVLEPAAFEHSFGYWVARCKYYHKRGTIIDPEDLLEGHDQLEAKRGSRPRRGASTSSMTSMSTASTPEAGSNSGDSTVGGSGGAARTEEDDEGEEEADDEDGEGESEPAAERGAEVGVVTANSEHPPVPPEEPVEAIEAELVARVRSLAGCEGSFDTESSDAGGKERRTAWPRRSPVERLRDWIASHVDGLQEFAWIAEPPQGQYYIVGSWNNFRSRPLVWDGVCFTTRVKVPDSGEMQFQFLIGGDWKQTLYPSVADAGPFVRHKLMGPDDKGHGLNWKIGGKGCDAPRRGERYRIGLVVDTEQRPYEVIWERLDFDASEVALPAAGAAAGETEPSKVAATSAEQGLRASNSGGDEESAILKVLVHIDCDNNLRHAMQVPRGITVLGLRERLARMDPTGLTSTEDFGLRAVLPCGHDADESGLLADEVVLGSETSQVVVVPK